MHLIGEHVHQDLEELPLREQLPPHRQLSGLVHGRPAVLVERVARDALPDPGGGGVTVGQLRREGVGGGIRNRLGMQLLFDPPVDTEPVELCDIGGPRAEGGAAQQVRLGIGGGEDRLLHGRRRGRGAGVGGRLASGRDARARLSLSEALVARTWTATRVRLLRVGAIGGGCDRVGRRRRGRAAGRDRARRRLRRRRRGRRARRRGGIRGRGGFGLRHQGADEKSSAADRRRTRGAEPDELATRRVSGLGVLFCLVESDVAAPSCLRHECLLGWKTPVRGGTPRALNVVFGYSAQ